MYSIKVIRGNIVNVTTDAIVNSANNNLMPGQGVNKMIFYAAGDKLIEACGNHKYCETGKAVYTKGYNIPAKYVIHAVGPYWHGGYANEARDLASCYISIMKTAESLGVKSIAIPALCTGRGGYPVDEAIDIAVCSVTSYLQSHNLDMDVWFMCYEQETLLKYRLKNMDGVEDITKYIDRKNIQIDVKLLNEEKKFLRKKLFAKIITEEQEFKALNSVLKRVIKKKYPDCVYLPSPKQKKDITLKTVKKYEKSGPFITMDCVEEYTYDKARMQVKLTPFAFLDTPEELESKKKYFEDTSINDAIDAFETANKESIGAPVKKVSKVVNVEELLNDISNGDDIKPEYVSVEKKDIKIESIEDANDEILKTALENTDSTVVNVSDVVSSSAQEVEEQVVETNINDAVTPISENEQVNEVIETPVTPVETTVENKEDIIYSNNKEDISDNEKIVDIADETNDNVEETTERNIVEVSDVEEIGEKIEDFPVNDELENKPLQEDVIEEEVEDILVEEIETSDETNDVVSGEENSVDEVCVVKETETLSKDNETDVDTTMDNEDSSPNKQSLNKSKNNNAKYKKSKKDYKPNYKPDYKKQYGNKGNGNKYQKNKNYGKGKK